MSAKKLDLEVVEIVANTIRSYKRNGFNKEDIYFKLRKVYNDGLIDAGFELCESEDVERNGTTSYALKESNNYYGWYQGPKQSGPYHWPRLKQALKDKTNPWTDEMLKSLDKSSSLVVSHLAPPDSKESVKVKGLVLGYIQSGKTANFSATIAKAVDEGYRLVIVLAGMHNNLRKQTEIRLREELVDPSSGNTCTTLTTDEETGDFKRRQPIKATRMLNRTDGFTLAVVKKNSSVLRNLRAWIEEADQDILLNCPTLIIDDESDQASINTNKEDADPTAINNHIRKLIGLFKTVSFVGYTATPFANVFIDVSDTEDLYPKDFLVSLDKPETYYGPEDLFGRDGVNGKKSFEGMPIIRNVPDEESDFIKDTIKKKEELLIVPSLTEAIDSFLIGATLRLCRGQWKEHSCMLVHISHLTGPQGDIKFLLERHIADLKYNLEDDDQSFKRRILSLYEKDFLKVTHQIIGPQSVNMDLFWKNMLKFLSALEIILDNSNSNERLTFDTSLRQGSPLWGIIVGGNTLSRGLTIEGLTTSYFIRDSKAYDTLLQMGRWFGYRKGYADLTRIYVTNELYESFYHLATVEQEIRDEIAVMAANQERPYDVALRIRRHPSLLVTARNRMRNAVKSTLTFSGTKIQTHQINVSKKQFIEQNKKSVYEILSKIKKAGKSPEKINFNDLKNCFLYRNIHPETILQFLDTIYVSENNAKFNKKLMQNYISELIQKNELTDWSVAVMSLKQGLPIKVDHLEVYPMNRSVKHESKTEDGSIEATLRAISTPGEELIDLADQFDQDFTNTDDIIEPKNGPNKSDTQVRNENRPKERGLLMIYPLQSNLDWSDKDYEVSRNQIEATYPLHAKDQIFAFTFVFPKSNSASSADSYLANPMNKKIKEKSKLENDKTNYSSNEIIKEIKVLNIAQPNAHDVIFNGKNVENRSMITKYRGTIAIYASKNKLHLRGGEDTDSMAFGAIIGFVDIFDCITKDEVSSKTRKHFQGPNGWVLENIVALKEPIPVNPPGGAVTWWSLSGEDLDKCLEQIPSKIKKQMKPVI
jgi:hypothetical protein